jgi:hypothetical protein
MAQPLSPQASEDRENLLHRSFVPQAVMRVSATNDRLSDLRSRVCGHRPGVKELYRGIAFRSWRMIGRAGARRATSLKPARANVEAVPTKIFDELFDALVSIG